MLSHQTHGYAIPVNASNDPAAAVHSFLLNWQPKKYCNGN